MMMLLLLLLLLMIMYTVTSTQLQGEAWANHQHPETLVNGFSLVLIASSRAFAYVASESAASPVCWGSNLDLGWSFS